MTARTIVAVHLAVFVPITALATLVGGVAALCGGSIAFALCLGLNLLLWRWA